MDSLKAELNTALQCDREAEEEVKKLKVSVIHKRGEHKSVGKTFLLSNSFTFHHRYTQNVHILACVPLYQLILHHPITSPAPDNLPEADLNHLSYLHRSTQLI